MNPPREAYMTDRIVEALPEAKELYMVSHTGHTMEILRNPSERGEFVSFSASVFPE